MPPKQGICEKCGGWQSHLVRHLVTCKGSVVENKAAKTRGLKRGRVLPTSTRVLRSRAGTSDLPNTMLRLADIGPELTDACFHSHAMSVKYVEGRGTSLVPLPSVSEEATTASEIIKCMQDIYGPAQVRFVLKSYSTSPRFEEDEKSDWAATSSCVHGLLSSLPKLPPHCYGFIDTVEDQAAFLQVVRKFPPPARFRNFLVEDKFMMVFSRGGILLRSHVDTSGGLLVLADGCAARGEVIFGDSLVFEEECDAFRLKAELDAKRCRWHDMASLSVIRDCVSIPKKWPHAVRWGGLRLCVGYFTG